MLKGTRAVHRFNEPHKILDILNIAELKREIDQKRDNLVGKSCREILSDRLRPLLKLHE